MSTCDCGTCPSCETGTFRSAILPALSAADAVIGMLDLAPTVVSIVTRRWSGPEIREGSYGDTVLRLPRWLVVEEISNREVMQSGGRFNIGDLKVGPIRPYFTDGGCSGPPHPGGFTASQLKPVIEDQTTEILYRCQQAHGLGTGWSGDYGLVELIREDPLEFFLVIRRHIKASNPIAPLAL